MVDGSFPSTNHIGSYHFEHPVYTTGHTKRCVAGPSTLGLLSSVPGFRTGAPITVSLTHTGCPHHRQSFLMPCYFSTNTRSTGPVTGSPKMKLWSARCA